jgi:hypothetical protein
MTYRVLLRTSNANSPIKASRLKQEYHNEPNHLHQTFTVRAIALLFKVFEHWDFGFALRLGSGW